MNARYIGIDYGTKRVGVAVSDQEGRVAFPEAVLSNSPQLADAIQALCEEKEVEKIVLGESRFRGKDNPLMDDIRTLKTTLEKAGFTVFFEPEHYTTAQANEGRDEPGHYDAAAATIILQSFLDKTNGGKDTTNARDED